MPARKWSVPEAQPCQCSVTGARGEGFSPDASHGSWRPLPEEIDSLRMF